MRTYNMLHWRRNVPWLRFFIIAIWLSSVVLLLYTRASNLWENDEERWGVDGSESQHKMIARLLGWLRPEESMNSDDIVEGFSFLIEVDISEEPNDLVHNVLKPKRTPTDQHYKYEAPLLPLIPEIDAWAQLHDRHAGERCLYVGNGPSIAAMSNFSFIDSFNVVMGVNKINLGFERFGFQPNYFATHNGKVIDQIKDDLIGGSFNRDIVKFIRWDRWNHTNAENIENNIVPTHAISSCGKGACKYASIKNKEISFMNDLEICEHDCRNCFCEANRHVVEGNTITYVALQILFYMGCEAVYLVGVDHNFVQFGAPNSAQLMQGDDPNHFDPNYFKDKEWDLADLESSEHHYRIARDHYTFHSRQIRDATLQGHLDVFAKASQEELYSLPPRPPLSSLNLPDISCRHVNPMSNEFEDPWLTRFTNSTFVHDRIVIDDTSLIDSIIERLRIFKATVCQQRSGLNTHPDVTIITATDDSAVIIDGFLENVVQMQGFGSSELILISSSDQHEEDVAIFDYMRGYSNIILVKLDQKPNLYDLLNYAIRFISKGRLLTTWNVDDRKPPNSLLKHAETLDRNYDGRLDLVSSWVRLSSVSNERWDESSPQIAWHLLPGPFYQMTNAFTDFFCKQQDTHQFRHHNVLHNSPMWRASFHNIYGWFDSDLDPLSDWELWLRAILHGGRYMHINIELDLFSLSSNSKGIRKHDFKMQERAFQKTVLRYQSLLPNEIVTDVIGRSVTSN